jgi:DNA-binding NarL/FixJ family response regulator
LGWPKKIVSCVGTRIAVLDQQLTVSDILSARLLEQPDVEAASAHTRPETLRALLELEPVDVVLLDWRMCDPEASLVAQLKDSACAPRVLVIGYEASPRDVRAAVGAGAAGWLPSDVTFDELLTCLRAAQRGEFWVPGRVLLWAVDAVATSSTDAVESLRPLTPREREVLQGMVDGLTREQIAQRLGMSPHTVRTHVHGLLHKLGVHSSLRAVAVARQAGLRTSAESVPHQRSEDSPWQQGERR